MFPTNKNFAPLTPEHTSGNVPLKLFCLFLTFRALFGLLKAKMLKSAKRRFMRVFFGKCQKCGINIGKVY